MSWISAADFARRMKCSRANVAQSIKSGRIAPEHVRRSGNSVLISTDCAEDWRATASKRRGINKPMPAAAVPAPSANRRPTPMPLPTVEGLPPPAWGAEDGGGGNAGLTPEEIEAQMAQVPAGGLPEMALSRARREHFLAELAQLELKREEQKLVSAAEVSRMRFESGRLVRDAVLRVPVRIMPELAAAAGGLTPDQRTEVGLVLERHLVEALRSLAEAQLAESPKAKG